MPLSSWLSRTIVLNAVIFLLLAFSNNLKAEDVTLQLKWFHQFQFAGFYAAQEKGFYAAEGINVEINERDLSKSHIDSVLTGDAEFGVSDSSLILKRLQGDPVVVIAPIFQQSPLVLLSLEKEGIASPADLKGKRLMRQKGVDDAAITAMLYAENIAEDEIVHIPHTYDNEALIKGQADVMSAYISDQPHLYNQLGYKTTILYPYNYGVDFYGDMLFTSEAFLQENEELVHRFRNASLQGWEYALANPEEIVDLIIAKYSTKQTREHLLYEAEQTIKIIRPNLIEVGHFNSARFDRIANIYQNLGMAPNQSKLYGIDYRDYLKELRKQPEWLKWAEWIIFIVLVVALLLFSANYRLKKIVKERTETLQETNKTLKRYLDAHDKHVIASSTDLSGCITYASEAFCQISGYSKEELIGNTHGILRHPDTTDELYKDLWGTIKRGNTWRGEILNTAKDGTHYWIDATIEPQKNERGEVVGYSSIRHDITAKKLAEKLSITDPLTGIYNRTKLDQTLLVEEERFKRYNQPLSVAILDLDKFKNVNDTYGHAVGDEVLIKIAAALLQHSRANDYVGRWGGEEFLFIFSNTNLEAAIEACESLRMEIESLVHETVGKVTTSIGVASLEKGQSTEDLLVKADLALYQAKREGRNKVKSFGGGSEG
jgi:diguanylate cyclase (GGDEF)-like protein/PAS domain S-box-containing protein